MIFWSTGSSPTNTNSSETRRAASSNACSIFSDTMQLCRRKKTDERSECKPDRAQPLSDERSECKPDRAQPLSDERSECKPDRAQPSSDERSECKPDRAQPSSDETRGSYSPSGVAGAGGSLA